jgi:osmotically-inducible protein OsmY
LSDTDLAEKVGFELSHAPRTWHLPQPEVAVVSGRVELLGSVPHETGRDELARVAAAVPGVAAVDNRLEVDDTGSSNGDAESGNGSGAGPTDA